MYVSTQSGLHPCLPTAQASGILALEELKGFPNIFPKGPEPVVFDHSLPARANRGTPSCTDEKLEEPGPLTAPWPGHREPPGQAG
ncbi:hypothetical protein V2G26_000757 [Clonostachys chloroleuca]